MFNKTKLIKLLVFSIIIFTLFLNLARLEYIEYCREYISYNNEIASNSNKNTEAEFGYLRDDCLKLKPDSFIPIAAVLGIWSYLTILISIAITTIVKVGSIIFRKKVFSWKEELILLSMILLAFVIIFYVRSIEPNYYFDWGCSQLLL
ncbi:MAG: hypothetical protein U9N04_00490 [Patescibacteria group bacterium]|nr:hypothetical protein [Patescibacteria group bacterium]